MGCGNRVHWRNWKSLCTCTCCKRNGHRPGNDHIDDGDDGVAFDNDDGDDYDGDDDFDDDDDDDEDETLIESKMFLHLLQNEWTLSW